MKKTLSILICIAMLASLAACGSSSASSAASGNESSAVRNASAESENVDIKAFAENVVASIEYDDELIVLSENVLDKYYDLPANGIEEYIIYVSGSAATTNELAVFKCSDSSALKDVKAAVESRLSEQNELYASYRPDEVYRLENALIKTEGNYLLLCVSNDNETVEKLFDEAVK